MFDVIALVVGAAQQILVNVLTDHWTGARAARKREIEKIAREAVTAREPALSKADKEALVERILAEVRYLVHEHPDLQWRSESVYVLPTVPQVPQRDPEVVNALLRERVERLNRIVRDRYQQVVVPDPAATRATAPAAGTAPPARPPEAESPPADPTGSAPPGGTEIVGVEHYEGESIGYWRSRLEDMRAHVTTDRRRRQANQSPEHRPE